MSDVWQGPGWWLASDGKWYPADASPGAGEQTTESSADAGTTTVAEVVRVAPESNGQSSPATEASKPASGWQAVDPEEEQRIAASKSTLGDDLQWSEPASEWTNAYDVSGDDAPPAAEITDVVVSGQSPTVPVDPVLTDTVTTGVPPPSTATPPSPTQPTVIPEVAPPTAAPAQVPDVGSRRQTREPIERDDAWRKPTADTPPSSGAPLAPPPYDFGTQSSAPEVVDLAIPAESPLNPDIDGKARAPWKGLLLGFLVVGAIVALAVLIGYAISRWNDGGSDNVESGTTTSAPTTDASAPTTASTAVGGGQEVSVFELRAGDCIEGEVSGNVQRLIKVDCSIPHQFEVYRETAVDPSITEFDHEAISTQADELCRTALDNYISPDDERDIKFKWFQPTEDSWAQADNPDRVITCLLFDEAGPLTGRAA